MGRQQGRRERAQDGAPRRRARGEHHGRCRRGNRRGGAEEVLFEPEGSGKKSGGLGVGVLFIT